MADIPKSKLGTKQHWDEVYERELSTYHDIGDVGEVWFGTKSMDRIINWIEKCDVIRKESVVIDVGCGNGMLLVQLADAGYSQLYGLDYSLSAVNLAAKIAEDRALQINYQQYDLLEPKQISASTGHVFGDICIDKGTYDAMTLNPREPLDDVRLKYKSSIATLLKDAGLFVLYSCNWTIEELKSHFIQGFEVYATVPTPSFQFGGKTGTREACVVFKKTASYTK